ncbi:MAG: MoxR family ATPase [Acidobacteria bacterium]|nr:MoxR family ATPase [Acidobacteriota bacterium]MCB9396698.1 MoxR family ATPase [Acidobacteriota bacterium]
MEIELDLPRQEKNPVQAVVDRIESEVGRVFYGQKELFQGVLVALLTGGHVLLEGVPGLGKTLLARALGKVMGCRFNRIQFTPDLMPADVTGTHVFDEKLGDFKFHPGPIFTNILLADEINRSPAKTHAALLEVMQERQVTVDGKRFKMPEPFLVIATQNPIETEGTYNLPEAQLDRFMFKLMIHYPDMDNELAILNQFIAPQNPMQILESSLRAVVDRDILAKMDQFIQSVQVQEKIVRFIANLVRATRSWQGIYTGASPRAGVTLVQAARTLAAMRGRAYVVPDDVMELALPTMRHRITLAPETEVEGISADSILQECFKSVEVPR